jgi:hypothetical protein
MAIHQITELSDKALTNELDLQAFLDIEYAGIVNKPVINTLRRRAARGDIPGARKDGRQWVINIEIYHRFKKRQIEQALSLSYSESDSAVDSLSPAERVAVLLGHRNS